MGIAELRGERKQYSARCGDICRQKKRQRGCAASVLPAYCYGQCFSTAGDLAGPFILMAAENSIQKMR